jgi:AraC-like DNA-binding protein
LESFEIIKPSLTLAPYVKHYWFLKTDDIMQSPQRIIPTGSVSFTIHRGDALYSSQHNDFQPKYFLNGQSMSYSDLTYSGTVDMICIVFNPIGAKVFFDLPMILVNNQNVSIDSICDAQMVELGNRVADMTDKKVCVEIIEQFLLKRLHFFQPYDFRRLSAVINSINIGETDILSLSQKACLGYKQFKRIFSIYVGSNPKDYLRTIRFQRALFTLQTKPDISLTELAYECNFYDQSHLIKEFKHFSGYTPGEYIGICAPYSDYFS